MTRQKVFPQARRTLRAAIGAGYVLLLALAIAGCAANPRGSGAQGGTYNYRSQQPPEAVARCFARNAEEHSSALVAEVTPREDAAEVIVRVKNGLTYATATFRASGRGSTGSITLMVVSSGGQSDLLQSLTEGC
jgi:hypothetical protein